MFDFLSKQFGSIVATLGKKKITEAQLKDVLQKIVDSLIEADVPHQLAQSFIEQVKQEAIGTQLIKSLKPDQQFIKIVHDKLKQFLGGQSATPCDFSKHSKVLVMGLQGSGKTTSIAKLAYHIKQTHPQFKVLVASVDFCRPAAIEQLHILAQNIAVDFYRSPLTDALSAARDIDIYFQTNQYDLLLLDTAGRLHIDNLLLEQLRDIKQIISPTVSILVLDAMTGQESLNVAKAFQQAVDFQYGMLSKMDSDTRGGAAFSFRYALQKPIAFIGTGEKAEDIAEFKPDRMAGKILDMGDIVTLAERVEKHIKQDEQQSLSASMTAGKLTFEDFAKQMEMMGKLGSMSSLMKYLPGMGSLNISEDMLQKSEQELKKCRAALSSMTKKERNDPSILDGSRKLRIARGAGLQVSDINLLLSRFEESKQYVKLFSKFGRRQGFFR